MREWEKRLGGDCLDPGVISLHFIVLKSNILTRGGGSGAEKKSNKNERHNKPDQHTAISKCKGRGIYERHGGIVIMMPSLGYVQMEIRATRWSVDKILITMVTIDNGDEENGDDRRTRTTKLHTKLTTNKQRRKTTQKTNTSQAHT